MNKIFTYSSLQSPRPLYHPLPEEEAKPDTKIFLQKLKTLYPKACILRSHFINNTEENQASEHMDIPTPLDKLKTFVQEHRCIIDSCICANIFICYHLNYNPDQCSEIEVKTRGQCKNNNWHKMRKGLLTASLFHQICCSTDIHRTAESLLKPGLNEDCLPPAMMFGRTYEAKARNMFLKGHRFRHRQCSLEVPGLVMYQNTLFSMLACSPDGVVNCKICGQFLVEVKCSFKYKCFHPNTALKLSKICQLDSNNNLILNRSHKYFDQIQGQMAVTGITKSVLVLYTHKGIATVDVDFDEEFWLCTKEKLLRFYRLAYFPALKHSILSE